MRFLLRLLLIGLSATFVALSLSAPLQACEEYDASVQATPAVAAAVTVRATAVDLSAQEKKAPKKKVAMKKKKKAKVEYMRAAPMPAGAK
jgi:hypothetical protein